MENIGSILSGLASFLWPIIILALVLRFATSIEDVLRTLKSRKFSATVAGNSLTVEEVSEQQGTLINDLQRRVVELQNAINVEGVKESESHTALFSEQTAQVESVLWVDDNPKNNSYLIQNLEGLGVRVTNALSTAEALSVFKSGQFQRVISDMGRKEGFVYRRKAGIELTKEIRKLGSEIPIVIFCDPRTAEAMREEALQAGANDITASATVLLSDLQLSRV